MKKIFFSLFNFQSRIGRLDYFILTMVLCVIDIILDITFYYQNGINVYEILLGHVSASDIERIKYLTTGQATIGDLGWLGFFNSKIYGIFYFCFWLSLLVKRLSDINISRVLLFPTAFVGVILLPLLLPDQLEASIYALLLAKTDAQLLCYILCYLFLCLKRGTVGENRHGLPPEPIFSKV